MSGEPLQSRPMESSSIANWEEDDFITALGRLESLQKELSSVRLIPRQLIHSLATRQKSPRAQFDRFRKASIQGSKNLDHLKKLWEDEQTQSVFEHCQESENRDGDLSSGGDIALWGWESKAEALRNNEDSEKAIVKEDPITVVEEMKTQFDSVEWIGDGHDHLQVRVKGKGLTLLFDIYQRSTKIGTLYDVESAGTLKENQGLSRSLANRKSPGNLRYLLEMLSAYINFRTEPCAKCLKHLDRNGMLPTIRRKESKSGRGAGEQQTKWLAFHESCD